jgi:hypothetical protein
LEFIDPEEEKDGPYSAKGKPTRLNSSCSVIFENLFYHVTIE